MSIDNPFAYETLAFDKGSVRSVDENGFLHVKISPLTRVQVAPYYGKEIPGWRSLGLDPDKIYKGYRPESELKKRPQSNRLTAYLFNYVIILILPKIPQKIRESGQREQTANMLHRTL